MRNLLIVISYDGKNYHGWQVQKNAVTVQSVFQEAIQEFCGERLELKGCSRTDTGVHANTYCVGVKTSNNIPCDKLPIALNKYLPGDISALKCLEVSQDFHARYSCKGKEYVYKIWNNEVRNPFMDGYALHYWRNIEESKLDYAAKSFKGKHDFTSFCTLDKIKKVNMIREIKDFTVRRNGSIIEMKVTADGFLYNMVRIMVGTLLRVAQGKIQPENISEIIRKKDRIYAGPTAPACGLYLNKVFYEGILI